MSARLRFVSGPSVLEGRHFYLERSADQQIFEALAAGESCALLGPPRLGRTSLALHVKRRLEEQGIRTAYLNLFEFEIDSGADAWLSALVRRLSLELDLPAPEPLEGNGSVFADAWASFLRQLLRISSDPIVLLFDEVNVLRGQLFAGAFFGALAALEDVQSALGKRRLSFCLISTVAPSKLVEPPAGDPFSIAIRINLGDFARVDLDPLGEGLATIAQEPSAWLDAVYAQTKGHPYLTQRLCKALVDGELPEGATAEERIAAFIPRLLGKGGARDTLLETTENAFSAITSDICKIDVLDLYEKILDEGPVAVDASSEIALELQLIGFVVGRPDGEHVVLEPRNPIFTAAFDPAWIRRRRAEINRPYSPAIAAWDAAGRDPELLPQGAELTRAERWFASQPALAMRERDYYHALLLREQRAQRRRLLLFAAVSMLALLLAAGLSVRAEARARDAEIRARQAEARLAAATVEPSSVSEALQKAVAANKALEEEYRRYQQDPSPEVGKILLEKLATVGKDLESARVQVHALTKRRDDLRTEVDTLRTESDKQTAKLTEVKLQLEQAQTRLAFAAEELDLAKRNLTFVTLERDRSMTELKDASAEQYKLKAELLSAISKRDALEWNLDAVLRDAKKCAQERDELRAKNIAVPP